MRKTTVLIWGWAICSELGSSRPGACDPTRMSTTIKGTMTFFRNYLIVAVTATLRGMRPVSTLAPRLDSAPVEASMANGEMLLEEPFATYANLPDGSTAIAVGLVPVTVEPRLARAPVEALMA